MTFRRQDQLARQIADLAALRAGYPHVRIDIEHWHGVPVWVARGVNGHPWLLASDDLAWFRRAMDGQDAG